ncbi:LysR family transcriptional regulator [Acidovorax kalamii]|jgi:DNA-binding transcriptional LysR family regulator|uniref:LysR family transcriptional regulator n=1 Tax=Acidovorax kalamii TaxID=2004485 RepID=A0A235EHS9_9BURK|nr:LysR family transcriptional regulator [Acidovorax kalamii]OYD48574.1 LysR family transcriptional regulator [Acidovorax kalamii]
MNYPDFQIDWLRAFVAVVDAGSLSGAAPLVHRSQSAVSMQIKKLETALGRPVLLRGPRHLEVTPAGAELLSYARRVLDLQAEAHAALFGPKLAGRVRLGVPDDYASAYLTPVLRSFAHRYQGVEIELTCEQSTSLIPRLGRGELDLALVSRDKPQRGRFLFDEPLVWVGAAQYEVWRRDPLPIAVYESASMARQATLSALAARRRAYRIVYHSSSLAGQLAAVESGLAVAVLTRCSVPPHLQILQNLPAEFDLPPLDAMHVAVLRSKVSQRSPAVDAMYEQMVRTLGD